MSEALKFKADVERIRYTIQAHNDRFFIMTKPFAARQTYIYTIADLERGVRGRCNLIFGPPCDFDTSEGAREALDMIQSGAMEVSHRTRNYVELSITEMAQLEAAARELAAALTKAAKTIETKGEGQ